MTASCLQPRGQQLKKGLSHRNSVWRSVQQCSSVPAPTAADTCPEEERLLLQVWDGQASLLQGQAGPWPKTVSPLFKLRRSSCVPSCLLTLQKRVLPSKLPEDDLGSWWWCLSLSTQADSSLPCPHREPQPSTSQKQTQLTANLESHLPAYSVLPVKTMCNCFALFPVE